MHCSRCVYAGTYGIPYFFYSEIDRSIGTAVKRACDPEHIVLFPQDVKCRALLLQPQNWKCNYTNIPLHNRTSIHNQIQGSTILSLHSFLITYYLSRQGAPHNYRCNNYYPIVGCQFQLALVAWLIHVGRCISNIRDSEANLFLQNRDIMDSASMGYNQVTNGPQYITEQ